MCKELWIEAYERRAEEFALEYDIPWEEAELILKMVLDLDPGFLDGSYA